MMLKNVLCLLLLFISGNTFAMNNHVLCPSTSLLRTVNFDHVIDGGRVWGQIHEYGVSNKIPLTDLTNLKWIISTTVYATSTSEAHRLAYQNIGSINDETHAAQKQDGEYYCDYGSGSVMARTISS